MKVYKKNKNSITLLVTVFGLVGMLVAGGTLWAATESTVTATVTVQNISVSLSQSSFTYGTLGQNSTATSLALFSGAGVVATNDGNVASDFDIYGADTANWTLGATAGVDQYIHRFCNDTASDCSTAPTNYTALTTSPQALSTSVASSGTTAFQLQINTPNPSSVYTQQSVGVTIQASAS